MSTFETSSQDSEENYFEDTFNLRLQTMQRTPIRTRKQRQELTPEERAAEEAELADLENKRKQAAKDRAKEKEQKRKQKENEEDQEDQDLDDQNDPDHIEEDLVLDDEEPDEEPDEENPPAALDRDKIPRDKPPRLKKKNDKDPPPGSDSDSDEDEVDPKLAEVERELNKNKAKLENRQQQMLKLQQRINEDKNKAEQLKKEKKKLLKDSPANTVKEKKKIREEIRRKLEDTAGKDDDNYSQAWTVLGRSEYEKMVNKLEKSLTFGEKVLHKYPNDREVLKSARQRLLTAQNYVENNSDKVLEDDQTEENEEELCQLNSLADELFLKIDLAISKIDKIKDQKSHGIKPKTPEFDPSCPSRFLSFHFAFSEAFRYQDDRIKVESYKQAIVGPERKSVLRLLGGVQNDFNEVAKIMMKRFGDIDSLLPGERKKIENLPSYPSADREEEQNLLTILEFWNLLVSHNAKQHFDRHLQYVIMSKLREYHKHDLLLRRPKDTESYIKRLEQYLSDINEYNRAVGTPREDKNNGSNGHHKRQNNNQSNGSALKSLNTGYVKKVKCNLCNEADTHQTSDCKLIRNKEVGEIKEIFNNKKCCFVCLRKLDKYHEKPCNKYFNKKLQKMFYRTCKCKSGLNSLICCYKNKKPATVTESTVTGSSSSPSTTSNSTRVTGKQEGEVLLNNFCTIGGSVTNSQVVKVKIPGSENLYIKALAIFDSHSENCLFSPQLRQYMENYKRAQFHVESVNDSTPVNGGVGDLVILSNDKEYRVRGLVKALSNRRIKPAKFIIPTQWREAYGLNREEMTSHGCLSIIFGADSFQYFPTKVAQHEGVVLERSFFDNKLILSGYNKNVIKMNHKDHTTQSNRVNLLPLDQKFLEVMNPQQGFVAPALCPKHRNVPDCIECKNSLMAKTRMQIHEEKLLEESLSFDKSSGHWLVKDVPYKANIRNVPNYEEESKFAMQRLVKKLETIPHGREYAKSLDKTVEDNIRSGLWAWESDLIEKDENFKSYQKIVSPINYSLKDSSTHSVRLVHNLSFSKKGLPSLNENQLTGTSLNQKLHLILLRQRGFKFQSCNDISRFYNQIKLSGPEQRKFCFLYKRDGILGKERFEVLCSMVLLFGARMAQFLANFCKIKTSELHIKKVDSDCDVDVQFSYTDDVTCHSNVSLEDLKEKRTIIQEGLKKGGFTLKEWRTSFDPGGEEVNISGCNSNLGVFHKTSTDTWSIKANVNFSKKVRNLRDPQFQIRTREELSLFIKKEGLRKINCLQAAHFLFDPLNLLLPVKSNLSLLYRELLIQNPKMEYQDFLPENQTKQWEAAIGFLLDVKDVTVKRCALPLSYSDDTHLSLVVFCDGGGSSSVSRTWIRASLPDSSDFHIVNLFNSFKLGDLNNSGAPKSEVTAMLMACRNIELVVTVMSHLKFNDIHLFSDSKVCLGSLRSFTAKLKLYFSDRVLEIQNIIQNHNVKVHFIKSELNTANYGSKLNLNSNAVLSEDYWTCPFLQKPENQWPSEVYHYDNSDISSLMNPKMAGDSSTQSFHTVFVQNLVENLIQRFSFKKVVNILSFVFQWKKEFNSEPVKATEHARALLYSLCSPSPQQISGLKRQFLISEKGDNVYLISRPFTLENEILQRKLRLLNGDCNIGKSLIRHFHIHCSNTDREIAKMFDFGIYIIKSRAYLKQIQSSCKTCIRIRQTCVEQLQGPGPQLQASLFPAYYQTISDVWGPIKVKTNKNSTRKGYVLSLTCCWTRHVSFSLLTDLTADTFLSGILTIAANLGGRIPAIIHSDWGSNIITIKKLSNENFTDKDANQMLKSLKLTFRSSNVNLILSSPKSPWRQGGVESLHRLLKLSLKRSGLYHQSYDISRWNLILAQQAQTLNQRILNIKFLNESLLVLTPNKLIFGEQGNHFPREITLNLHQTELYSQLNKLEKSLNNWRDVWNLSYRQEIQKFLTFKRKSKELGIGDVVLITDHPNPITKFSSLGQIVEKLSPRTVKLKYTQRQAKLDNEGNIVKPALIRYLIRPVQNLVYITSENENISVDPFYITRTAPLQSSSNPVSRALSPTPSSSPSQSNSQPEDNALAARTDIEDISDEDSDDLQAALPVFPKPPLKVKYISDTAPEMIKDITKQRKIVKPQKQNKK